MKIKRKPKKDLHMSRKYRLNIYKSNNRQNPYYVKEWDECFTEEENKYLRKDTDMIEQVSEGFAE